MRDEEADHRVRPSGIHSVWFGIYLRVSRAQMAGSKYLVFALLCTAIPGLAQQVNDPDFPTSVEHPAFTKRHPRVGIDEAHRNFHTRDGRYKPFAMLLESDGYLVATAPRFDAESLKAVDILVIANAMGET